jgi:hypothetical protein
VKEQLVSEPEDLVDVFYVPFVRPLGNLVILFAQAEAELLALVTELSGHNEREAQGVLKMKPDEAKQKIISLAHQSGVHGFELEEFTETLDKYYCDRERRNRIIHDEWYISILSGEASPRTRGLPFKKGG